MKRVLLISYVFPPEPSPGALRPLYLTRYLPQFGWKATVITHSAGAARPAADVIETRSRGGAAIDRLPFRVRDLLLFPDATASWIPSAIRSGIRALRAGRFDAILSTAHPPSVHVAGAALSVISGLPWIADYRDAWTGNPYLRRTPIRSRLERIAESILLARTSAITAVSEPIAGVLKKLHPHVPVTAIPNGYDPEEWNALPVPPPAEFELVFTGSMHDGKRSPDLLFQAVSELAESGDRAALSARITFYGANNERVAERARRYGVAQLVSIKGIVPRLEAMARQRSAAALLVFLSMDPATSSEMGSKYLEYIGAGRPILAFGPPDSALRAFIGENRLGWFASTIDEAKEAIACAYACFAGATAFRPTLNDAPTAQGLAREFSALLNDVAEHRPPAAYDARELATDPSMTR